MAESGVTKRRNDSTFKSSRLEVEAVSDGSSSTEGTHREVMSQDKIVPGSSEASVNEDTRAVSHARSRERSLTPSLMKFEKQLEKVAHWAWKTVSFESLPHYLQDNEFLKSSHRPPMNSFQGCFKSIFRMHTETWNIWTHLLGFAFFLFLVGGIYVFGDHVTYWFEDVQIHSLPWDEQFMLMFFFVGAMGCMLCSTMFHTFSSHSKEVFQLFIRLDYSGIAFLITGSSVPAYYYGFYCTTIAGCTHIAVLLILCALCVAVSMKSKFSTPKYRPLRFAVFVLFGLYGVIPSLHILIRDGYTQACHAFAPWSLGAMAAIYILGAVIYVLRIPERFSPGRFDIWASSHQLFHVCVIMAALVHYDTLLNMIKYRLDVGGCIPMNLLAV